MRRLPAIGVGCMLAACSGEPAERRTDDVLEPRALVVYATSYPLAFFAERIGGSAVEVLFPVPQGIDPAHWNPDADMIARAQAADLLLRHGAGDPAWLDLASLHRDRVVDATAGVRDRLLERKTARHQYGPAGEHSHGERAGTTWLDPTLAAAQVGAVAEALAARRPDDAERFRSNLAELTSELAALDEAQTRATRRLGNTPLLFSHPVYAYLETRYSLNVRSVVWEPDAMPSESQWRELLEKHAARTMLWEAEPLPAVAERLAALGIESMVYAPCANRPQQGDWLGVMNANLQKLETLAETTEDSAMDSSSGAARIQSSGVSRPAR